MHDFIMLLLLLLLLLLLFFQQKNMNTMARLIGTAQRPCAKVYLLHGEMKPFHCPCGCAGFGGCCEVSATTAKHHPTDHLLPCW